MSAAPQLPSTAPRGTVLGALLAALLAVAAARGWAADGAALPQPARLVFARQTHDFGRVRQGDVVAVEFPFANRGDIELSLSAPRAACDCSAELAAPDDVAPGGGGVVRVRFDTSTSHGAQRRTVTLHSNDPERRSVILELRGEVVLDVAADPPALYLGEVTPGARFDAAAAIRTSAATAVYAARSDGPYLSATLAEMVGPPFVTLEIRGDAPRGPFSQTVRVTTSSARHPTIEIPVHGIVVAEKEPTRWQRE